MSKKVLGTVVLVFGIIAGILFIVAGSQLSETGNNMKELRSVAGTSLAEAYYQEVGGVSKGFSMFSYGMGAAIITLAIGLGGKLIVEDDNVTSEVGYDIMKVIQNGSQRQ